MIRSLATAAAVALALLALAVTGCSRGDDDRGSGHSVTQLAEPDDVLDDELMVALLQAKNFHHKADVYLQDGAVDEAIAAVREVLAIPFPAGAPEAHDVLLDARARLGKLLLGKGASDEALRVVDEGIAGATRESYFLANVYTVRGEILESRAAAIDDEAQARALRIQAIEAFDRSIRINETIQKQLMKELGK